MNNSPFPSSIMCFYKNFISIIKIKKRFCAKFCYKFGLPPKTIENTMLKSMNEEKNEKVRNNLRISPSNEMKSLINALNGGYVNAGKGNEEVKLL